MDGLRHYIIAVTAAAILCGIVKSISEKTASGKIIKLICSLCLGFTVLKPITQIDLSQLAEVSLPYADEAVRAAALGEKLSQDALMNIIKVEAEAYILDKAAAMNVSLEVSVTVEGDPPVPAAAQLSGEVSPYAKQQLEKILWEDLGISKEYLEWTG